jgi:hypothetical protein
MFIETEADDLFVIEFDHRSDEGDRIVGPFASAEAAQAYMKTLEGPGFSAEYAIISLAGVTEAAEELGDVDMPVDELEEGEEEITEIPVHGVATLEGKPTGDGRGFRPGALSFGRLPAPLGYEFESSHGGGNSRVAVVGRIDEFWTVPAPGEPEGVFEVRWRGAIILTKDYAAQAIESIIDGSYDGLSVIVDDVTVDVTEQRESMRARILADQGDAPVAEGEDPGEKKAMSEEDIEELLDAFIGDGQTEVTWFNEARIRRFDMVPTGAFMEGYAALGHEFPDELTAEQIEASAAALADCGCLEGLDLELAETVDVSDDPVLNARAQARAIIASALDAEGNYAPGTKDGPGWITHPTATARIRRYWVRGAGAAKIKWGVPGDFNRCRMQLAKYVQNPDWLAGLCSNMHKEAIGVWPGQEGPGGRHSLVASATPAPLFSLTAAAPPVDASLFANPGFTQAEGIKVEGERITGYIAVWNVCHIGDPEGPGRCTLAPRSATSYAHFRTGTVNTTEGPIAVGSITMSTGHAGGRLSAAAAAAHYDNTGAVIADVACGEDRFGIWFSGRVRPGVTDEQIYEVMASGRISGDWRRIGGNYELVAGLVVNVAGYPFAKPSLVASGDYGITAIIGEGIFEPDSMVASAATPAVIAEALTADMIADIAITAAERVYFQMERRAIVEQLAPARAAFAAHQLRQARSRLALMTKES